MCTIGNPQTSKHFGWYRPKLGGKIDSRIYAPEIEPHIHEEFRAFTKVVELIRPFFVDYLALTMDAEDVFCADAVIADKLDRQLNLKIADVCAGVDANAIAQRRIGSFLAAASAFRDRSMTRLVAEYSSDSKEVAAFKSAMSAHFDSSFAYRCLYQLRNYAQHHELPISFIPINADREPGGELKSRVAFHLFPTSLASSGRISKKVRGELLGMTDAPLNLSSLVKECMQRHDQLMALILSFYRERLEEMAYYASEIYRTFEVPHDAVPVIWEVESPLRGFQHRGRMIMMGFDEMERAFALMDKLNAI